MLACSCGVAHDDNPNTCPASRSLIMIQKALPDSSVDSPVETDELTENLCDDNGFLNEERPQRSTLIEFPGRSRPVPEWRRQLSQRVREVQERKAREAAEELAAAVEAGTVSCALPSAQLELVPDVEQPAINPIVSKALERLERARRTDFVPTWGNRALATAAALAPIEEPETDVAPEVVPPVETKLKLTVVAPEKKESASVQRKPVRVISEEIENTALSYLDSCLEMPPLEADNQNGQAGVARRMVAGILDLLLTAVMVSPFAAAIEFDDRNWSDPRVYGSMIAVSVVTLFAYQTISNALTGRTLAMRMLSLRTIDLHTGMIPTGGQSTKRAFGYVLSLSALGLGLLYAFVDPDGRTMHDRFSKTIVVRDQKPETESLVSLALN
jgi:uncharacterized RDD family membrane protein YckC